MSSTNGVTPAAPVVERATLSDIPDLIAVWWDAFTVEYIQRVYPPTPDGRRWLERFFEQILQETPGPNEPKKECLVVRSPETGRAVAIAIYSIIPAGFDPARRSWRARLPPFDDLPGIREEFVAALFDPMDKTNLYLLGDRAHIYLETLGTMEAHQRKGYGSALVRWGTDLADKLGVECYLDASPAGKALYEAYGYVAQDVSAVLENPAGCSMVRPRKRQD